MRTKTCTKCGIEKPITEFSKHKGLKDGYSYWCLKCNRDRTRIYRQTPSGIYTGIKGLQKFHNRKPVTLSRDEFVKWYNSQPQVCHYCGIHKDDLPLFAEKYHSRYSRLTVDCKDNEVGYVLGNIVLACDKCNITKNNMLTYEEMLYVGQNFIKPKWEKLKPKE